MSFIVTHLSTRADRPHRAAHAGSPVQGDAAQVQYGRRGEQDIQRRPHEAEGLAVDPVMVDQLDGAERHHQHRDEQVGECQRNDEVVGLDFPDGRNMFQTWFVRLSCGDSKEESSRMLSCFRGHRSFFYEERETVQQ